MARRQLDTPVVLDMGSAFTKAGLADEIEPAVVLSTPRDPACSLLRPDGTAPSLVQDGVVLDWGAAEACIARTLLRPGAGTAWHAPNTDDDFATAEAKAAASSLPPDLAERPLLWVASPLADRACLEQAAEVFYESMGVPALYMPDSATLALFSSGRTTGLVVDSGDEVTLTMAVERGRALLPTLRHMVGIAGRDLTDVLAEAVRNDDEMLCRLMRSS